MPRPHGPPGNFRLVLCPEGGPERIIPLASSASTIRGAKHNVRRWAADVGVRGHILVQEKTPERFVTRAVAYVKDSELTHWEGPRDNAIG